MRTLTQTLLLLAWIGAVACSGPPPAERHTPPGGEDGHAHHAAMHASAPGADAGSIYALDSEWRDQQGRSLHLSDLAGRPRVVALVYTHCAYACPRIIARMKRIEAAFEAAPRGSAPGFVLVSIDPERDTPERLATFASDTRLEAVRWTLLNGPDDRVRELSVLLGVPYRAGPDGAFTHANVLTVLDGKGVVTLRLEGLDGDLEPAIEALRAPEAW